MRYQHVKIRKSDVSESYGSFDVFNTFLICAVVLKAKNGQNLIYTKALTGQGLNEVSLDLKNAPARLFMNGTSVEYDARGYSLESVVVEFDGINKKIVINNLEGLLE